MPVTRRVAGLVVWLVVVAGFVVGAAAPASAHALLLRTAPSPQSTVPTAPGEVRLHFSEPVEAGAGDVCVFDVNGKRVDLNRVSRTDTNREVDLALPVLSDGTYTVTWRAVSADTHAVRGGFVFYVGHPSSISAVAIDANHGAGRTVGFGFGVQRFAWFAALMMVVGLVSVRRLAWTPALRAARMSDSSAASRFRRWFARLLVGTWAVLAFAGVSSLFFQAATVEGIPLTRTLTGDAVAGVLDASFGHLWLWQVGLTVALFVPVVALVRRTRLVGLPPDLWIGVGAAIVAGLCVVAGLGGHARTDSHPAITVTSIAIHLLSASVWAGGLAVLVLVAIGSWAVVPAGQRLPLVAGVVRRFSGVAMVAVAALVVTGTLNSAFSFHAVSDLWSNTYGRVVGLKALLLLVALALAVRHRLVTQRRLHGGAATDEALREVRRFERLAGVELGALVAAVALAAALVALVPGRTLALAANGPVNTERQAGAYTIQLLIDPTRVGTNEVHITYINSSGLAAGEVTNTDATIRPLAGTAAPAPLDLQLIGPGHFVAETPLPAIGRYRIDVGPTGSTPTTFTFTVHQGD